MGSDIKMPRSERLGRNMIESGDYDDDCKELIGNLKECSEKIKDIKREAVSGTEEHSQGRMNEIIILNAFIRDAYNNNIGLLTPKSIQVIREQELFCKKIVAACESDKPEWEIFAKLPNDNKWKKGLYNISKYFLEGSQLFFSMLSPSQLKNWDNVNIKHTDIFLANAKRR